MANPGRYPIYVNIWKRDLMDTRRETMIGIENSDNKAAQLEAQDAPKLAPAEIPDKN